MLWLQQYDEMDGRQEGLEHETAWPVLRSYHPGIHWIQTFCSLVYLTMQTEVIQHQMGG